jgi:hypothetical protein
MRTTLCPLTIQPPLLEPNRGTLLPGLKLTPKLAPELLVAPKFENSLEVAGAGALQDVKELDEAAWEERLEKRAMGEEFAQVRNRRRRAMACRRVARWDARNKCVQ